MDSDTISQLNLLLQLIKNIRDFDGTEPAQLPDFIQQIDNLTPLVNSLETSAKLIIVSYIKNKCVGETREIVHRERSENWEELKNTLKKHYGEKSTCIELMDELKTLSLILTHNEEQYTREEVNRIGLITFRDHLPEPTKTLIFSRNPNDLEEAFKLITEARHHNYTKYGPVNRRYSDNRAQPRFSNSFSNQNTTQQYDNNRNNRSNNYHNPGYNRNNMNNYTDNHNYNNSDRFYNQRHNNNNNRQVMNDNNTARIRVTNNNNRNGNYQRSQTHNRTSTHQTRHSRDTQSYPQPMDIGNVAEQIVNIGNADANFQTQASNFYPI
ncbi:putative uncharacterized protein DDB_G0282499 [Teleopsis dalmanni]|uniref:putative uncharacterized protein DDB_G0282499 n=1 Tax=Teleopsis dalmanni TaxID=139649 RepID=UPI0018CCE4B0|nr:putative uncharacterized protein DDB_G0282499 [Teleopsis dalmanni]